MPKDLKCYLLQGVCAHVCMCVCERERTSTHAREQGVSFNLEFSVVA